MKELKFTVKESQYNDPLIQWGEDHSLQAPREVAYLWAAAPELLFALKRLVDELPTKRDWLDPLLEAIAKDAIAKAEGSKLSPR
jgi:hypothetical protein